MCRKKKLESQDDEVYVTGKGSRTGRDIQTPDPVGEVQTLRAEPQGEALPVELRREESEKEEVKKYGRKSRKKARK